MAACLTNKLQLSPVAAVKPSFLIFNSLGNHSLKKKKQKPPSQRGLKIIQLIAPHSTDVDPLLVPVSWRRSEMVVWDCQSGYWFTVNLAYNSVFLFSYTVKKTTQEIKASPMPSL